MRVGKHPAGHPKLKHVLLSACILMLVSPMFQIAIVQRQSEEGFRQTNVTSPPVVPLLLNDELDTQVNTNQSLAWRSRKLDVAEDLPAKMKLSFSESPVLYRTTELDLVLDIEADAPNTEVYIYLPEGFSLSSGSLRWNGDLSRNVPVRMAVLVRAEIVGVWRVDAVATSRPSHSYPRICSTACYVNVTCVGAYILDSAPESSTLAEAVELPRSRSKTYAVESISGNVTVHGYWFYRNWSGSEKPARYARVELWASKPPFEMRLARTYVQSNGYYEFPPLVNNGSLPGSGYDIYVKLFCESWQYQIARVEIFAIPQNTLCWSQTDMHYNVSDGDHDMGSWVVTGSNNECWAAYDAIVDEYFWFLNKVSWSRSTVRVTALHPGQMCYSTGNGIVLATTGGWDRGTVLHEYGHCINYAARGASFPPSDITEDEHYPDTESDGGWAFREGWAEFCECAVDNDPRLIYGSYYGSLETTTYADGPFGHGDYGDWDGNVVEGAVAQVFWDILDGVSSSDHPRWDEAYGDYVSDEFAQFWHIFDNHRPDNISALWAQWTPKDARIWAIFHHARILLPRNIAITGVTSCSETVATGEPLNINVTVENQGGTVESFNLTASANGLVVGSVENVTLGSHCSGILKVVCDTTGMVKGDYEVSARAIVLPKDLNLTDDMGTDAFTLVSLGHDVSVSDLVMSKTAARRGYVVFLRLGVRNIGSFEETFNVTFSANSTVIGVLRDILLASGHSTTLTLKWNTTDIQRGNYVIEVSALTALNDTDITDNTVYGQVFIAFPGDVDGDLDVDIIDIVEICTAYCSRPPGPPYAINLDLNEDGIINIIDLVVACSHYGQK